MMLLSSIISWRQSRLTSFGHFSNELSILSLWFLENSGFLLGLKITMGFCNLLGWKREQALHCSRLLQLLELFIEYVILTWNFSKVNPHQKLVNFLISNWSDFKRRHISAESTNWGLHGLLPIKVIFWTSIRKLGLFLPWRRGRCNSSEKQTVS